MVLKYDKYIKCYNLSQYNHFKNTSTEGHGKSNQQCKNPYRVDFKELISMWSERRC